VNKEAIIRRESKALLRHMGGNEHKTISYPAIALALKWRDDVTPELIQYVITALEASEYTFEINGAGDDGTDLGQRLTASGRRIARKLRAGNDRFVSVNYEAEKWRV